MGVTKQQSILIRRGLTLAAVIALSFVAVENLFARAQQPVVVSGEAMGTIWHVKVPPLSGTPDEFKREMAAVIDRVEDQMSTWRPDSEISQFNQSTQLEWFPVSKETATVVQAAIKMNQQSGGAFDATIYPLVKLWNFGPDAKKNQTPTSDEITAALKLVGSDKVEVRLSPPALRKEIAEVTIDLSAIAKGFGVDQVARYLENQGLVSYMVEIGGEVRTKGFGPFDNWRIGISQPQMGVAKSRLVVEPDDEALATSGDYQNYYEVDGKRISHTIDPRTGSPIEHGLASVSVIADDCMTADARATALSVLGPEEGFQLATKNKWPVYMIVREDGAFVDKMTPEFRLRVGESDDVRQPTQAATSTTTFVLAAVLFGLAIIGLASGVIISNKRLKGSCGGLAGMKDEHGNTLCEGCTNPAESCLEKIVGTAAVDGSDCEVEAAASSEHQQG